MKKLSTKEVKATQRIFNRVDRLSGGYYGRKVESEAAKFVSLNRWIMFPVHNVSSLREGTKFPAPNIFVFFDGDVVSDDEDGRVGGYIGVTYNNVEAMAWLLKILRPANSSPFISVVNSLGPEWYFRVQQKIKTVFKDNTPRYRDMWAVKSDSLTVSDIKKAIADSNSRIIQPNDFYEDEPVLWCVTVVSIDKGTRPEVFDGDARTAFDLFNVVLCP